MKKPTVLILCTGNSARSILGEALVNRLGNGCYVGKSAGSAPTGRVNPLALGLLQDKGYDVSGMRSKSWDEFAGANAAQIDFVFTVCDNAAGESCPLWPGHPMQAHWGIPDPAGVTGTEEDKKLAFEEAYRQLEARIQAFVALDFDSLSESGIKEHLSSIGRL